VPKVIGSLAMSAGCRKFRPSFGTCRSRGIKALQEKGKSWIFNRNGLEAEVQCRAQGAIAMTSETTKDKYDSTNDVADLYWLAFLLTGRQDLSIEIASDAAVSTDYAKPLFSDWMRGWQRRLIIGRALTAVHGELADSARRTKLARGTGLAKGSAAPQRNWSLSPGTTKAELQQALLAIDLFPRAALLLLVFEGIQTAEAATLLDADATLIRKAQAIGLRELAANLAGKNSPEDQRRSKPATEAPKKLCCWLRTTAFCH
jgi:DNA-directed RNA polymerase specialized sigma24 family protein